MHKILAINPGSTSTKIGVFDDNKLIFEETIRHLLKDLVNYEQINEENDFRRNVILRTLEKNSIDIKSFSAVVARGGLLKPIEGGTYLVNDTMLKDLNVGVLGEHASNLGGRIAHDIARQNSVQAYIVDPVVVDELQDVARISGIKEIERVSIFHALNQKSVARRYADSIDQKYEDLNLIVVHLGGGISVGGHEKGRVIDVANALNGEGPFSPERSGSLPVGDLVKLCYSGKYTLDEVLKLNVGKGGLISYLNTNNAKEVSDRIDKGDKYAKKIYYSMAYQVSKEIGAISTVLKGNVDAIILTGGIAYDKRFTDWIIDRVGFISEVYIHPGEDELSALAEGVLRILNGKEKAKEYI